MFRSKVTRINYTLNTAITETNMAHEEELLKVLEKKIIAGIDKQPDKNNNYLTNVQGKMTAFNFFNSDPDFKLFLESMFFRWSQDSLFYEDKSTNYTRQLNAQRGMIITFPSYVQHWVDPVNIPGKRVTLAWNWSFDKPWGDSY